VQNLQGRSFAIGRWVTRKTLFGLKDPAPILAAVEVGIFIAIPIMNELKEWYKRAWTILKNPSSWITFAFSACFILALIVPWHTTVRIPAVLEPAEVMDLYSPATARVVDVAVELGDHVVEGQPLYTFSSEEIDNQAEFTQREIDLRVAMLDRIAADDQDLEQNVVLMSELKSYKEELAGLE